MKTNISNLNFIIKILRNYLTWKLKFEFQIIILDFQNNISIQKIIMSLKMDISVLNIFIWVWNFLFNVKKFIST
jgi:hypothetical protein